MIFFQTIAKEIYDSQDEIFQFIQRDRLNDKFSIWFKIIESGNDAFNIVSIFQEEYSHYYFIKLDQRNQLTFCLQNDCEQVYVLQEYQNGYVWFHIIISNTIKIEEPIDKILFKSTLLMSDQLVLVKSPYYKCLIYPNVTRIIKRFQSFSFEKLVRPQKQIELFSQESVIQLFLKRNKESICSKEDYLFKFYYIGLFDIQFNEKDCNQFQWNNMSIVSFSEFQVSQWFEIQLAINYQNIKFSLILQDFTYTDEYIIQKFDNVPLYFNLILNLQSQNYIYQSSNYYQFYNQNEIQLCHQYCQNCQNKTCLRCYVKGCECQVNQFFNIISKQCQYYSQLNNIQVSKNQKITCQRGFIQVNQECKQYCFLYEGHLSKECYFDKDPQPRYFQFQEDLLFRHIYLNPSLQHLIYAQFFDPSEELNQNQYEILDDQMLILMKNKNVFLVINQQNGYKICRFNYFGNSCQFKPYKCLYSNTQNCQICQPFYFLKAQKCKKCPKNCQICEYAQKKIICLVSQEQYYLHQNGIPKICSENCYMCRNDGTCIGLQEIIQLQKDSSLKQIQLECDIQSQIIYDLEKQKCHKIYQLSNVFQWVQSVILSNIRFLGQYQIPYKEQLIVNYFNINNSQLFLNHQVSLIYKFEQLKQIYYQILNDKLAEKELFNLQMRGSICTQKYIHLGQNRCLQSQQNMNLYDQDKYCFLNDECKYNLTLNVYVMAEGIYSIIYENQKYFQIMDLLSSIQNLGMVYGFVKIDAQLIINKLNSGAFNYENLLVIQKDLLPKFLKQAQFQIILNYRDKYIYENLNDNFVFEIVADYVNIDNLFIYTEIIWKINCLELIINNTQIINTSFKLQIEANRIIIINTLISDITNVNNLVFRFNGQILLLLISDFIILNSQFENFQIFQIANINEALLYDVKVQNSTFFCSDLFNFQSQIQKLKIHKLVLSLLRFNQGSFIIIQNIISLQITQTKIQEIDKFGAQPLFSIQLLDNGLIMDFAVYQSKFQFEFFYIQGCQTITFNNVQLQITAIIFLKFIGDEIFLNYFQIYQLDKDQLKLFQIFSNYTQIENLYYIQEKSNEIHAQQPYLLILATQYGFINNLKFVNTQLIGSGLLFLENINKLQIQNIIISNCSIKMSKKNLPNFINVENYGSLILENIQIKNLSIQNNQNNEQFSFIFITGKQDRVTLSGLQIENVITNNILNFLLSFQNQYMRITKFTLVNFNQMNPFYINSQNTQIEQGQIIYQQSSNVFFVGQNMKQLNVIILIRKIKIHQLYGTFIKNTNIDENYTIILHNIQLIINSVQQQININLKNTDLQIINMQILQEQIIDTHYQFQNFNNILLRFQQVRLYVKNLTIFNFCINLGEFQYLQSTYIDGLFIQNIQCLDSEQQIQLTQPYISFILNSPLVIRNIHIYTSSFNFNDVINISVDDGSLILDKIYINDIKNINSVFNILFRTKNKRNNIQLSNFFIQDISYSKSLIYVDSLRQMTLVQIKNLFLRNCIIKQLFENKQNISIIITNSLLFNIDNLFNQIDQCQMILIDSDLINFKQNQFFDSIVKNSIIFDEQLLSFKVKESFSFDLSFDHGLSVLKTKRLENNINQIYLNNQDSFFYLPTGQPITKYQRLNLKTMEYKQIYNGFSIVVKGLEKQSMVCDIQSKINGAEAIVFNQNQLILNQAINLVNLTAYINPNQINYISNDIICDQYILRFNNKGFRCQLGEYLYNNSCLQCDIQKGLYSTQYNSTHCYNVNYNQISQLKIGLVKLRQNYWRHNFNSIVIEQCPNQYCNGGWKPGDHSCSNSRIGALCQECDLYNKQGYGHFTKNVDQCQICEITYSLIYQSLFSILWQLFLTFISIYSKDSLSKQLLFYKVGKRNFYKVLYKLSLDQPAVIVKMLTNYLFFIYLIRQNFNSISQFLILNLNMVNNPNLIMEAQMDCIFRQIQNIEIIYVKFLFSLCNLLFISNIHFIVYLLYVKFGNKFQLKLLLLIIVEIFIFNLQIILEICFKLLSYQEISQIKWVQMNKSYQYFSKTHFDMIYQLIIPTTCILLLLPLMILFLFISNFTIMKIKIFSLFQQKYKSGQQYWGFITIYTKFIQMAISIINKNLTILQSSFCLILLFLLWKQQPYYLKNLNQIDLTLLFLYEAVIHCLMMTDNGFIFLLIFLINIPPIISISNQLIYKIIQLNREQIVELKQLINARFSRIGKYLGGEKDMRKLNNLQVFRDVIRQNFLTQSKFNSNSKNKKKISLIQNNIKEIELGTLQTDN
ncbi:hypothetical protein pb186bvf_017344 [Paramecium bursaria]